CRAELRQCREPLVHDRHPRGAGVRPRAPGGWEVAMRTGARERESGFALVVVLWIVALLALQVGIFNLTVRDAASLAVTELALAGGEALASSGVELAAARLMETDAAWRWQADGRTREVAFGGARLAITIIDEAGRFDINELDDEAVDWLLRP